MTDWQKDPVLMEMQGSIRFLAWTCACLFIAVIFALGAFSWQAVELRSRLDQIKMREQASIAAQADRDWREINRRLNALESRTASETCTQAGFGWPTPTPAIGSTMLLTTLSATRRSWEIR